MGSVVERHGGIRAASRWHQSRHVVRSKILQESLRLTAHCDLWRKLDEGAPVQGPASFTRSLLQKQWPLARNENLKTGILIQLLKVAKAYMFILSFPH
jgi:hypothetical protein